MASTTPLNELTENFFMCSVCLNQFKEPKLLPCLHRYCRDCLNTVIQASQDGTVKCPLCQQDYVIPENGVDDFKSDFHMKSMLEFVNLQKSFEYEKVKQCVSCSENTKVFAYCFKCRDFLCDPCYMVHVNSQMFTEHQTHILKLDNVEARNLTLEKLRTLTEDPKCHIHMKKEAKLCCCTCRHVPVCIICIHSKHKGHDLQDVSELATSERELLKPTLAELNKHKDKLYDLPKKIETTLQKLNENAEKKTQKLINQHQKQTQKINDQLEECTKVRTRGLEEIESRRRNKEGQITINLKVELSQVREKYDKIRKNMKRHYDDEYEELNLKCDKTESALITELDNLNGCLKDLITTKDLRVKKNKDELKEMSDYCDTIIKRYENFTATTSSILAPKNDWTYAQCIPDIRAACEPLIEEMKKGYPQLEYLSDFIISDITKFTKNNATIVQQEDSVVDIAGIKATNWSINGITSSGDGNIVITGMASTGYSHITVVNRKVEIQRQEKLKNDLGMSNALRYCCSLSKFKVITVCKSDNIGIYDVRDGAFSKKKICDVITKWPFDRYVKCVTTYSESHIIVGTNSRCVYVLTDQLIYSHMITLPNVIDGAFDITVHRGNLLVCSNYSDEAYAVTMEESESKLMYEFPKPDLDEYDWNSFSVCTDKNEFIYMLWCTRILHQRRCILVQYSQDGRQLLTRTVDNDASCVTNLERDGTEELLLATKTTGKLYTYCLEVT
ncbi:uncharacterized protein [Apostichopus japonicus]|uniref:uncharacterized protein isoform X1 n=2 Tax=Stichopus japonicus TaxID=307972 RepID=UPI003AB90817